MTARPPPTFGSELEEMMYGFGDAWPSDREAIALLDQIVIEYIQLLCKGAGRVAELTGKFDKECFKFLVHKNKRKYDRITHLISTHEELKSCQKQRLSDD